MTTTDTDSKAPDTRWERCVRWLRQHPVGMVILFLGVMIPIAANVQSVWAAFASSDLAVSPLSKERIRSRVAHPVLETESGPVYPEGVEVDLTLQNDSKGSEAITVRRLTCEVVKFTPGIQEDLSYLKVRRKGVQKVGTFRFTLAGKKVTKSQWLQEFEFETARSGNVFDLASSPFVISLPSSRGEGFELRGRIEPAVSGLYELVLVLGYNVAGKDKEYRTKPIRVYHVEPAQGR